VTAADARVRTLSMGTAQGDSENHVAAKEARACRHCSARASRDEAAQKALLFTGGAAVATVMSYFNRRRRHEARDRALASVRHGARAAAGRAEYAAGVARGVAHKMSPVGGTREYDDVTLARKVETAAQRVRGVSEVRNLLHTAGSDGSR